VELSSGVALTIRSSNLTGNLRSRFIDMKKEAHLTLINVTAVRFGSTSYGGVVRTPGYGQNHVVLVDVVMSDNKAMYGGCMHVHGADTFSITRSHFTGSTATTAGGVLAVMYTNHVSISSSQLESNSAPYGGAIYAEYSNIQLHSTGLLYNTATTAAAGIYMHGNTASLTLTHNTVLQHNSPDDINCGTQLQVTVSADSTVANDGIKGACSITRL